MDLSPLWISLRATTFSTLLVFFTGIAAAYHVLKLKKTGKSIVDCIITLPMILPPTVVGFFLLKLFGINGPIGRLFLALFDRKIVFTWQAAVISASVVAFPLMYRSARGAFEQVDKTLRYSAQTLGLSDTYIFWRIVLPNCRHGILAGTVLAFARGMGEFGATIMLAGNLPGRTQTISVAVYAAMAAGNDALAYRWVMVNLTISFAVLLIMNLANGHTAAPGTKPKRRKGRIRNVLIGRHHKRTGELHAECTLSDQRGGAVSARGLGLREEHDPQMHCGDRSAGRGEDRTERGDPL